jgi:hypothetical protein
MKTFIKAITFVSVVVLVLVLVSSALADRTDVILSSTVDVYQVELKKLRDGGCEVEAFGLATSADGGRTFRSRVESEISGAARTNCLNVLNNAENLWKTKEEL